MFGLDLDTVILDKATVCSRHYVSDIYIYIYIYAYHYLSCNQYICCTNMLYEYIFALFVLDE
jgi:hypothetical protein